MYMLYILMSQLLQMILAVEPSRPLTSQLILSGDNIDRAQIPLVAFEYPPHRDNSSSRRTVKDEILRKP